MNAQKTATAETAELRIEDVVYRGRGLARQAGCVVLVPGVLPGETVRVRIVRRHKNYAEAELLDVAHASPLRREPACPLAGVCPGCVYQHAAYEEEVRLKAAQLANLLERLAGVDDAVCAPPVASPRSLEYRSRVVLHAARDGARVRLGYFAEDNRTVLDVPRCPLAVPPLNERLQALRADRPSWPRSSRRPGSTCVTRPRTGRWRGWGGHRSRTW